MATEESRPPESASTTRAFIVSISSVVTFYSFMIRRFVQLYVRRASIEKYTGGYIRYILVVDNLMPCFFDVTWPRAGEACGRLCPGNGFASQHKNRIVAGNTPRHIL